MATTEHNIAITATDSEGTSVVRNLKFTKETNNMATTKKYVSLEKLGLYDEKIKQHITNADAQVLTDSKAYSDSLSANYDPVGSAAAAEASAKAYADGKDAAIAEAKKAGTDAAAAAQAADDKAVAAQTEIDALETYVGAIPEDASATDIVGYVQEKTAGIATEGAMTELGNRMTVVEGDVAAIKDDYLKSADKVELEGKITEVATAVDTEKSRAEGVEAGLESRLAAVEGDYLNSGDKEELQGNIDTLTGVVETLRDGIDAEKVDGVKDLISYVEEHGTEVTGMKEDIATNASDIEAVAERMTTAEGKIDALQGAVETKVEQSVYDAKISELAGVDEAQAERITALETKFGGADGSVEDMIAVAKQEAIDAAATAADAKDEAVLAAAKKYADDEDALIESRVDALEVASATHALASDLTALAGRVEVAEGEIDTLQSEMDAVESLAADNKTAHEANASAIALKASQSDLEAVSTRVATMETWQDSFVECSQEDINSLFA